MLMLSVAIKPDALGVIILSVLLSGSDKTHLILQSRGFWI